MRIFNLLMVVTLAPLPFAAAANDAPAAGEDGFVSSFNGRDLTGWITGPGNAWVVEDGVIALKDRTDGRMRNENYLWTQETYGNDPFRKDQPCST